MAAADYIAAVLADLPRGYWTLEDAGPTNAADSSGNSHTATATSITWEADGPEDSLAVGLTAPNSYLTIPDSSDWVWTDVTLEAWVYPGAAGAGGRMSVIRHQAASGPYLFLALSNLVPEVGSQPDGFIQTRGSALTADTWYHLAAVRDRTAGTWTVYLNGSQIGTTISAAGGSNIDITGNLMIGAWAGGTSNRYDGRLAHVAYYTTALSAARVAAHYNAMLSSGTNVDLDPAAETDTAPDLTPAKSLALATPAETDTAPELTAAKATTLAAPVETDRAPALGRAKVVVLDLATETDTAPVLGVSRGALTLAPARETARAPGLVLPTRHVTLDPAVESTRAPGLTTVKTRPLDLAAEVDRALELILPVPPPATDGPTVTATTGRNTITAITGNDHATASTGGNTATATTTGGPR